MDLKEWHIGQDVKGLCAADCSFSLLTAARVRDSTLPSGTRRMAPGGVFVVRSGNYTPEGESGAEGQGEGKL